MSYGVSSDEVAEDYRKALEDLTMNSRYEISNLTVIAKENTEHALAISEALKTHIKQTSPQKKLPAFYVLDSVVKNVGTPYTLFFGRQLYSTFMEAYALVDNNVRRKMDEMLKTWKEPVPGSIDTRPVFPPDVTRPIENALIKARTSAVQAHQEHLRSQQLLTRGRPTPSPVPYRDTPTPPNALRQQPQHQNGFPPSQIKQEISQLSNGQLYPDRADNYQYNLSQRPHSQSYSTQPMGSNTWQNSLSTQGHPAAGNGVDSLSADLMELITTSKADFAQNPWDASLQRRLKALLDLQAILQNQTLPHDQIALIREQVTQLSQASQVAKMPIPPVHIPSQAPVAVTQPTTPSPSLSSILGPGALAALLARQMPVPKSDATTFSQPNSLQPPALQQAQPQNPQNPMNKTASLTSTDATSLLEKLRAAGMLPTIPTIGTPPVLSTALDRSVPPGFPPSPQPLLFNTAFDSRMPQNNNLDDLFLKQASLKIPRLHLISRLYGQLGVPCTQCGRRFQSDENGRRKKTLHMDWHFRVHQRMSEAEKRGQHRSWYTDELDWIKYRELEDDQDKNMIGSESGSAGASFVDSSKVRVQYLAVPDDPALAHSLCPICQEKFEMKWLDDAQEFVWIDAKKVGDKIYHASCHAEVTETNRGTPEPILGKRKAEDEKPILRTKIKTETIS